MSSVTPEFRALRFPPFRRLPLHCRLPACRPANTVSRPPYISMCAVTSVRCGRSSPAAVRACRNPSKAPIPSRRMASSHSPAHALVGLQLPQDQTHQGLPSAHKGVKALGHFPQHVLRWARLGPLKAPLKDGRQRCGSLKRPTAGRLCRQNNDREVPARRLLRGRCP